MVDVSAGTSRYAARISYRQRRKWPKGKIMGLLRVLLAFSVVLSHLGGFFGYAIAGGFASVQMFYVISGFYMATILTEKYDPRADVGIFYSNRFLRIYSIYFVCLLISLFAYLAIYVAGNGGWLQYVIEHSAGINWPGKLWLAFIGLFVFFQESTVFLELKNGALALTPDGPGGAVPVWLMMPVPQAWSISLELVFYCLVPILVRNKTSTLIAVIAASLALRIAIYSVGYESDPWLSRFFPLELGLFVLGMVARRIYDAHIASIPRHRLLVVAAVFLAVTCIIRPAMEAFESAHISVSYIIWPYYLSALLALPCLFHITRASKADRTIGNFSYPVYLIHWIVMTFYDSFAGQFQWPGSASWIRVVICVSVTFFLSWIIVMSVEAPLDRYRQRRVRLAKALGL